MNASILQRSAVILGAIAIPWVGCSLWSAQRVRAAKEALAAEIRAEMEARTRQPDRAAGRADLDADYRRVLGGLPPVTVADDRLLQEAGWNKSWESIPPGLADLVTAHAGALGPLDALVADTEPGFVSLGPDWSVWGRLLIALRARGRVQLATRDWPGFFLTVRAFRRVSEDLLAGTSPGKSFLPGAFAVGWSDQGQRLLEAASRDPGLTEQAAVEALALSAGPWSTDGGWKYVDDHSRDATDQFCLDLLRPDAKEVLRGRGLLRDDSILKRAERLFESRPRTGEVGAPPSVETVRRMREVAARYWRALEGRDGAAMAAGGDLRLATTLDLGDGWTAGHLGAHLSTARFRWREEARLPVLRAALAVRIHEARTGRPPATLAELVPSILEAVPVDAWTGKPVTYTLKPGGGWSLEAGPPQGRVVHEDGTIETTAPHRLER